jgi:transglutaminase-like putative cysteine protease
MDRRTFLRTSGGASAGIMLAGLAQPMRSMASPASGSSAWRTFEVITRLEILKPAGVTRAWVPMPLLPDTDYHKNVDQGWTGNAATMRVYRDDTYGAGIFFAEWPGTEAAPVVEVTARFSTRDRAVDLAVPGNSSPEDKAVLKKYLSSTRFIATDGIVRKAAREITKSASTDVDKAKALYEWIVDNTFRDPKVRGCGLGDIKAMLETGNLGGKCADLNALFVGMARSVGIPARDIYGVRVADSAEYKSLGRSGDITKAQHCRAEFYSTSHGWVPVDPADVRKLVLEENGGIPLTDPKVQKARVKLFGALEMNWLAYNYAADLKLPNSSGAPLPFFMYPQAETANERRDSLDPDSVRYRLTSKELTT